MMFKISLLCESIGSIVALSGLVYEMKTGAEIGYILITLGSCLVAIGSMIQAKILRGARKKL